VVHCSIHAQLLSDFFGGIHELRARLIQARHEVLTNPVNRVEVASNKEDPEEKEEQKKEKEEELKAAEKNATRVEEEPKKDLQVASTEEGVLPSVMTNDQATDWLKARLAKVEQDAAALVANTKD
jgi:hypothetical protein